MRLKKVYSENWKYLKKCKNHIILATAVLLLSALIGYFFPIFFIEEITALIRQLIEKTQNLDTFHMIIFIFSNNLLVSFIGVLSGVFFGIAPLVISATNGYLIGFVSREAVNAAGLSSLWRLFPHGIFELPAVLLSLAMGVKLGTSLFLNYRNALKEISSILKIFIFIVIPLLIVAGIIEGILIGLNP